MDSGTAPAESWEDKCRKATEAWNVGKRRGFPLIRPGLEYREPERWTPESDN